MVSTKRVILANGSQLLRQMLHRAIDKAEHLEVVQEIPSWEDLPASLLRFGPEWVIITQPYSIQSRMTIDAYMEDFPSVRFIFLSPGQNFIKMKWQTSCEEDYADLSLEEFIHILEKDPQPI